MNYIHPAYYDNFSCLAGKCQHSCCVGWEIDIDESTYRRYERIDALTGSAIMSNIVCDDSPHFHLTETEERCPFLNEDGLCNLIIRYGEDILCDICTEHPRFYNEYSATEEVGVGACCEAAAELILYNDEKTEYILYGDSASEIEDNADFLSIKYQILSMINDEQKDLNKTLSSILLMYNKEVPIFEIEHVCSVFSDLEIMSAFWARKIKRLRSASHIKSISTLKNDSISRNIVQYLIYRHLNLDNLKRQAAVIMFACLGTALVREIADIDGDLVETFRLFSAEVEYSETNIESLLRMLDSKSDLLI